MTLGMSFHLGLGFSNTYISVKAPNDKYERCFVRREVPQMPFIAVLQA